MGRSWLKCSGIGWPDPWQRSPSPGALSTPVSEGSRGAPHSSPAAAFRPGLALGQEWAPALHLAEVTSKHPHPEDLLSCQAGRGLCRNYILKPDFSPEASTRCHLCLKLQVQGC